MWFEPGNGGGGRDVSASYRSACPSFYGHRPAARFRYFVAVRRHAHHTLCLLVTTFAVGGGGGKRRKAAGDCAVLHPAAVEPPEPHPTEGILPRTPLAVVIDERAREFISPFARLDCSRVYTVEDDARVLKIGRVHRDSLALLEQYFRDGGGRRPAFCSRGRRVGFPSAHVIFNTG